MSNCLACHAPHGLHTADCHRAYRAAYDKATQDASAVCEELAYAAPTHSATQFALHCAEAIRHKVGHSDDPA